MVGPGARDHVDGVVPPVEVGHLPEQVAGGGDVGLDVTDLVAHRVVLVAVGDDLDVAVEGGREEDGLALLGRGVEQALHRGQEAHVGHAVGLVDHDQVDLVELDVAALDEVLEATGAGDEHVDALAQGLALGAVADAAVDGDGAATAGGQQRLQLLVDLLGQLAGRGRGRGHAGLRGRPLPTRVASGMPKARVLPEPVGARPQTSRPARRSGSVAAWMGKGSVAPRRVRTSTTSSGTPSSANEGDMGTPGWNRNVRGPARWRGVPAGRGVDFGAEPGSVRGDACLHPAAEGARVPAAGYPIRSVTATPLLSDEALVTEGQACRSVTGMPLPP